MILLLLGFIISLFLLGIFLYRNNRKQIGKILISFPFVLIIFVVGWWVLETNYYFVSSTNLEYESIGDFRLQDTVTKGQINSIGSYEKREQDPGYSYDYGDFFVRVDSENKIVSLSASIDSIETSTGLKVGDSIARAKKLYGKHYYSYKEMGLGKAIVYVDKANEYKMTIWTHDNRTVADIWLAVY